MTTKLKTNKYRYKNKKYNTKIINKKTKTLINLQIKIHNNEYNDYKSIFTNKNVLKDIIYLKKQAFDIFYSCKYKYPLLVKEYLNNNTGKGNIKRQNEGDPWNIDNNIQLNCHYLKGTNYIYETYEFYGGSPGHNAPASWYNFDINKYKETFLNTNITPQNINFNSGIWNFLELWSKLLVNSKDITNINIFTGSIPNTKSSLLYNAKLEKIEINIPTHMFKIICFNHSKKPNITFVDIFIFTNKTYNIKYENKTNLNFIKYILPIKSYNWFENKLGISIIKLLKFYNINSNNIKSFKNLINLKLKMTNKLISYSYFSIVVGNYIESKTLAELYSHYNINLININQYLKLYFYKIRNKLIRETLLYTKFTNLNLFNKFFTNLKNNLNTIYNIEDKDYETKILDIEQDKYLNNYYNIVKKNIINKKNNI